MKTKALIAALFLAGFAASFALADGGTPAGTTSGATTTTGEHGKKPKCEKLELKGSKGSGSITFTVDKANKHRSDLAGKPATLTIPADAMIKANACRDASGALTLRELKVTAKKGGGDH